jgi:hypothetical protein
MTLIRILILLLICTPSHAAIEWLVPTGEATGVWTVGAYTDIDECDTSPTCTPNDTDKITTATKNDDHAGIMSDLVTADSDDTYNSITVYGRSQLTGTPGNETVEYSIIDGAVETHIFDGGSNGSFVTDNSGALTTTGGGAWTFTALNAITYNIDANFSGGESVTNWEVSVFYVAVDYTAVAGSTQVFYVTKKEWDVKDFFDGMPDIITID